MLRILSWTVLVTTAFLVCSLAYASEPSSDEEALAVFNERIMPIFRSPKPSSCVQCHLASVDLKDYIQPSHEQTFVSLRDQGLIDLEDPDESKILDLIAMGERDLDKGARLIHARTRDAEYEAFAAWIRACCKDVDLRSLPAVPESELAGPDKPDAVIRHARKDRLLDSFVRNVWSQRMRCYPCHTPNELNSGPVPAEKAIERHAKLEKQYGQRINIFRETPAATMQQLIISSRSRSKKHLPLINVDEPGKSLLVLKPISKLPPKDAAGQPAKPSSVEPVSHGGGLKMHVNDQSYKSFLAWIQDYAKVVRGEYADADQLPADNWSPTAHVLRVRGTPESWERGSVVQLFVHAWDEDRRGWQKTAAAFTQGTVTPRGMVNGSLFLISSGTDDDDATSSSKLASGKYLIKAYVDRDRRVSEDPTVLLNDRTSDGDTELQATWGEGFRNAEVVEGNVFK